MRVLLIVFMLLLCPIAHADEILIIIEKVPPKPTLVKEHPWDAIPICDLTRLEGYVKAKVNHVYSAKIIDNWPVGGTYEQVIDNKGPIWTKGGVEYRIYSVRSGTVTDEQLNAREYDLTKNATVLGGKLPPGPSSVEVCFCAVHVNDARAWLERNGYEEKTYPEPK